ncbi:MAG TPA: hypothetical protein VGQ12_07475 [Candidatus Angelobacter sp.]|jgi:hypothetical protein|nr:hypothetical protein [Candidatus Angelobacter sp.]
MNPCDTCAFRNGAEANSEPYNRLRALVCAVSGIPFYCHHGFDWQTTDISLINRRFVPVGGELTCRMHACAGWKREVARFKANGQIPSDPAVRSVQRQFGEYALCLIKAAIDAPEDSAEKEAHWKELRGVMEMLFQRPGQAEEAA